MTLTLLLQAVVATAASALSPVRRPVADLYRLPRVDAAVRSVVVPGVPADTRAQVVVRGALSALAGSGPPVERWRALRETGVQHEYLLGNAERAEGPWRVSYTKFAELHASSGDRLRRTEQRITGDSGLSTERVVVLSDSVLAMRTVEASAVHESGGTPAGYEDLVDRLEGSPERALTLALRSPGLAAAPPVSRYGVLQDVVQFPFRNGRLRIEVSRESHLPSAVEVVRTYPDDFRRAPFGDIGVRFEFQDWTAESDGMWWPHQQIVSLNGHPLRDVTIASVAVSPTAPPADSFLVSDSVRAQYAANALHTVRTLKPGDRGPATEIAPGVLRIPDFWTTTVVKQADGLVLFEAHISASYLHGVVDEAHQRFPGLPVKAVIMTSDPWAHLGGFREAVAMGIPIYVNARSIPFLTALAASPHTLDPDSLSHVRRAPRFIPVVGKRIIGSGPDRIELYPVGGPYGERMTIVYFPAKRLLYGADFVFHDRNPDGSSAATFWRTPTLDLRAAVARQHLAVDSVFSVQARPTVAWKDFMPSGDARVALGAAPPVPARRGSHAGAAGS